MIESLAEESSRLLFCLRNEVVMETTPLLPLPEGMLIDQIQITEDGLVITVVATHPTSCCPLCSRASSSIQSHYRRMLRDAPCVGRRVQLLLTVQDDHTTLPADHIHWFGDVWKRRSAVSRSSGDTDLAPNDSAPHYGFAQCLDRISCVSGNR